MENYSEIFKNSAFVGPVILLLCNFLKNREYTDPSQRKPREHRLGEVLQGRSKSKFYVIISYWIVIGVQVYIIKTIWTKNLKIPCSNDPKYLNWKLSNFLNFLFFISQESVHNKKTLKSRDINQNKLCNK